jgi:regulator of sigma E protease
MSVIIFIIILVVLILAHELGHFLAAKSSGIRVDEFGIGFPPKIIGRKIGETTYTLNLIPFGGFVKIFGENPDDESISGTDSKRSLVNKPKLVQAWVLFAGVFFNFLLAWALISVGFMSGLPTPVGSGPSGSNVENAKLVLTSIKPNSPAGNAGLSAGDTIVALVTNEDALQDINPESVSNYISRHGSDVLTVLYKRGSKNETTTVIPIDGILEKRPAIGITMDMIGILKLPIHKAIWEGGKTTVFLTIAMTEGFYSLIRDSIVGKAELSSIMGPVGIVGLVGDASDFGFIYLLGFTAFISINLAIINLIPFPALDGGRILFLIIEAIKRSPIKPVVVNTANAIGFALLIILMLVVTYNDIVNLFVG